MLCLGVMCFVYLSWYKTGCFAQCLSGEMQNVDVEKQQIFTSVFNLSV